MTPHHRYVLLGLLFVFHGVAGWPGRLLLDSQWQYQQALAGIFDDHHPVLMSALWSVLLRLYPAPGLIWLLSLVLFYLGVWYRLRCFGTTGGSSRASWVDSDGLYDASFASDRHVQPFCAERCCLSRIVFCGDEFLGLSNARACRHEIFNQSAMHRICTAAK
jgi:hypothetical protein